MPSGSPGALGFRGHGPSVASGPRRSTGLFGGRHAGTPSRRSAAASSPRTWRPPRRARASRPSAAAPRRAARHAVRGVDARLDVRPLHPQHARRPVGLEVDAADDAVAEQVRQHVVAVDPLRRRRVDLDAVGKSNSRSLRSRFHTSESNGLSSARAVDRPRHRGVAVDVRRLRPALDRPPAAGRPPRRARRRAGWRPSAAGGGSRRGRRASPRRGCARPASSSSLRASASVGVGASSALAGSTRSVRS